MSAERFQRLGSRVNVVCFWGNSYTYGKTQNQWKVQIEFHEVGSEGVKINFEIHNAFLEDALHLAYERLDKTVSLGLGASAMMPAIEYNPGETTETEA